tara:strand:- start:131 stop:499 length:369 start_codon:yes stop_codon:yes gene_type:complete
MDYKAAQNANANAPPRRYGSLRERSERYGSNWLEKNGVEAGVALKEHVAGTGDDRLRGIAVMYYDSKTNGLRQGTLYELVTEVGADVPYRATASSGQVAIRDDMHVSSAIYNLIRVLRVVTK